LSTRATTAAGDLPSSELFGLGVGEIEFADSVALIREG
jgi:hypothetical protein